MALLAASALGLISRDSLERRDGIDLLRAPDGLAESIVAGRQRSPPGLDAGYLQLRDVGYRTLPADPPGRLRFRVRVPERSTLHFACGVEPARGAHVSFRVRVIAGTRDEAVWQKRIRAPSRIRQARWVRGAVDLARYGGRTVDLVLETTAEETGPVGAAWGAPAFAVEDGDAPLVVLYVVDTLRADHTGPYGYARPTTPELDRFARDGIVFDQAVAHAPWTKPSIASVMTSLLPVQHGASRRPDRLDEAHVTLAEALAERGWATGAVVGNAILYARGAGFEQGFDYYGGLRNASGRRSRQIRAARAVDAALEWIDSRRGRPTFLYVHTMDPHSPYSPPAPWDRMFSGDGREGRADGVGGDAAARAEAREAIARYDGEIAYGDAQFGRFVRELKRRGIYDRALLVFLSDHGEEFLDHGHLGHGRTLFDELVRVPLVVKLPGGRARGRRVAQQVQGVDVMPTILRAARVHSPGSGVGRPLQAVIDGGTAPVPALLSTQHWGVTALGVRTESEKYIRRFSPDGEQMYFDLDEDETERDNRAAADPGRTDELWEGLEPLARPAPYRYVLRAGGGSRYTLALASAGWLEADETAAPGVSVEVRDGGHGLRIELDGSRGAAREVRVRVRPAGASVRLSGTRNGRGLRPPEVSVAGVRHPTELPFVLPRPETENPLAAARRLFRRPSDTGAGLWVWLAHASPEEGLDLDEDTLRALEVLGYAGP